MIPPIEIKVNLDRPAVTDVLDVLGCATIQPIAREIWFAEARVAVTDDPLPLLASHLAIRLRSGDRDDVTVQLRPCVTEQLVGRWTAPFEEPDFTYRLEQDWCGSRQVMSSSAISNRAPGSVAAAVETGMDPAHVLDASQRQFVVACTTVGVPIDHLMTLGPVASTTWPVITIDQCSVHVERWTVRDVDLLELSTRVWPRPGETVERLEARALARQEAFETALTRRGLRIDEDRIDTKTHQVMAALTCDTPAP